MKPKHHSFSARSGSAAKRHRQAQSRQLRSPRAWLPLPPALRCSFGLLAVLAPLTADRASADTRTWIGGNVNWVDNAGTANWSPADEPDSDDDVIFNAANTVNLGSANFVLSLALSNGISLNTNNFGMNIYGLLQLTGAGTDFTIGGSSSTVWTDSGTTLNASSRIYLEGGVLAVPGGIVDNNSGCTVSGRGVIALNAYAAAATTMLDNDGTLAAAGASALGMPAADSLVINGGYAAARLDLDGTIGAGIVSVGRNQLLDINVVLSDSFSGTMNLSHASTIDLSSAWSMNAGTLDADNGAITIPSRIAANTSYIAGAAFTQTGGIITVVDSDGTLQFNAPFTQSGGDLVNNGLVVFNADATIGAGANFTMPGDTSSLTVNPGVEVNIDQADFNADGNDTTTNIITVGSGGILDLDLGVGADEILTGLIRLNGGELDVTTVDNTWGIGRNVTVGAATGTSQINGEAVDFYAVTSIGANSVLRVNAPSTFHLGASIAVASGARLELNTNTLDGITSVTGAGTLQMLNSTTVAANSTIAVDTFDWDGIAPGTVHTINDGVTLTINSPNIDTDGSIDDTVTLRGTGSTLVVSGPTEWNMDGTLNSNPAVATTAGVGGTSRVIFGGAINANSGTTWISAPATLGATAAASVAAGAVLHFANTATFEGGVVTGAGTLRVNNTSQVNGYNTISVQTVDWDGTGIGSLHSISDGATLAISCTAFDDDGDMDDPLNLGGGGATLNVSGPASWNMLGTLTANPADSGLATVGGTSRMILTSASGILNANGDTTIAAPVTLGTASMTNVAAAALLTFSSNNATFAGGGVAGAGTLRVGGTSAVTAATTIDVNTFDWDGTGGGSLHSIDDGVTFTINSPVFDSDGDMDDPLTIRGDGGRLAVNGPVAWTMLGTLTTNPAAVGSATIAGTSRLVLSSATGLFNVNGTTNISAPITFGPSSTTTVAVGANLNVSGDALYEGGTITGAGNYRPPVGFHNAVTASSTISTTNFNFDYGNWTVLPDMRLTVNVSDYDSDSATNAFDTTLVLNSGIADVNTADPVFVMNGSLEMNNTTGVWPYWTGEAIQIGDDAGTLDADLMVAGTGVSGIYSAINFKSDAEVNIAAGATLWLFREATFEPVNGAVNASFTGTGTLITNDSVYYNEATTLNLTGGHVDLDGASSIGETHHVAAPLTINVATFDSFGKANSGGGYNIIDVNGWPGTGSFTVNLDSPSAEWTLNKLGVLILRNNPAAAGSLSLLAGSDANLTGHVQVTGDVRTTARVDVGGTIDIQTAGKPFRLSGGDLADTNTLMGGTINGPGILGADNLSSLYGYGTINSDIDFDSNADLFADNGTLTINGSILDARFFGTNDTDGVLDVVNAWNSNTVLGVFLKGGELKGGLLTNDGSGGISGSGLVSSRVINNTIINATNSAAPLIVETATNNNDWDGNGTPETGQLQANAGTLEIRSIIMGGSFFFNGTVTALNGGTVFASGFALAMESDSTLNLTTGTFKQSDTMITDLSGTITVGAGNSRLLGVTTGGFRFNATSTTTLTGNLQLDCPATTIQAAAAFAGAGRLINLSSRRLIPDNLATVNVLVENRGILTPGSTGIARNNVLDYVQTATGSLAIDLNGAGIGNFDRLLVNGNAQLAGSLQLSLGGGYVPVLNDTMIILSATAGVTGTFSPVVQPVGMPAGLAFEVIYNPTNVQLKVVASSPFDTWINTFGFTNPADKTKAANPDSDELNNLGEFATDGNPASGVNSGKIVGKIAPVGRINVLTLTLPVRNGTLPDPADPVGGELGLKQAADGLFYKIQASDDLLSSPLTVTEVTGPDAAAIQLGLPALNSGWTYRTFRSPGPVAGDPIEFMRVKISE
ncbi:MAG: hypothetical protein NTW21_34855 [Verrucomicrobia bacterium]|nr:hypothetical protein [Verrucomicrobiota bacterium]